MSKKILKMSPNQVLKQVFANSQTTIATANNNSTLCGQENQCGLFNPFEETLEDKLIKQDDALLMDILLNTPEFFGNDNIENDIAFSQSISSYPNEDKEQQAPRTPSKFSKKIKDLNLKINIPAVHSPITEINNNNSYTPGTENMFNQFIQSIPTPQLQLQLDIDTDAQAPDFDLLDTHFGTDISAINFEKLILGCTPPTTIPIKTNDMLFKEPPTTNDHEYTSKRKLSETLLFDDSFDSSSSSVFTDSFSSDLLVKRKNQRTRGIYRADDVTNQEELTNYLERRKKNNVSSKISRANKKRNFNDMDYRCDELERNNCKLNKRIVDLEKLNKVIKDMLVEKFTQTKP